jgi:hypothetical protein
LIFLFLLFFLSACPASTSNTSVEKSPEIATDQIPDSENPEAQDEDDEDYDSSAAYSQDSDSY